MDTNKADVCVINDKRHAIGYIYQAQKSLIFLLILITTMAKMH